LIIRKLNHRDRRARRGKNAQTLKVLEARIKTAPFPTISGILELSMGPQMRNSALYASSLFTLLSSIPEDRKAKRNPKSIK